MPNPLISILVAVYNGASTLQQCIDSVALQDYPNKELIIIDGDSSDETTAICKRNDNKISYWISEKDTGIFNAWNKGLMEAKGEWICFLGADDYFFNATVLSQMSAELEKLPKNIHIAYAQVMLIGADGDSLFLVGEPWNKIRKRFVDGFCLPHQGVMHRHTLFELHGKFDESFRVAGDYELLLRELKSGMAAFIPAITLTAMRQGGLSSHPSSALQTMNDIRRAQKMHGQSFPSLFWLMAIGRVYIRLMLLWLFGDKAGRYILDKYRKIKGLPAYWTRT